MISRIRSVTFIFCALLAFESAAFSQQVTETNQAPAAEKSVALERPNALSLEILGRGGLYSLNYDFVYADRFAFGFGASYVKVAQAQFYRFPVYINYSFSPANFHALATLGYVSAINSQDDGSFKYGWGNHGALAAGGGCEWRARSGFLFRGLAYYMLGSEKGAPTVGVTTGFAI